jgi:hypothetical protein
MKKLGFAELLLAVGDRLSAALSAEASLATMRVMDPSDRSVFERWAEARRKANVAQREYDALIRLVPKRETRLKPGGTSAERRWGFSMHTRALR